MSDLPVTRWIRGYDKHRGRMLVEYLLPDSWTLDKLQRLFGVPEDNPMYDSYPINGVQASTLGESTGYHLFSDDYEFFLEADANE
jgi:hypothetical protein